ncbi:putative heptosyliii transferase [Nautilia profundicola AmH]|uniref:Heptosyliii transferase n=1 Tax=Nautilia profundicola (strain ATCC BAA-1463 / DSM 18972 / AmH) TaxID=598659 RepID=B9L6W1_NAUPA|nr:glycosyltransferase family 9 protein [Nautilia profundicola]ACM92617.1 putative heptosyliii transferase [Nautilia profundicola AmH]
MKILLIRNDNLGDLICTTPSIEALRKKYPDAQIDIVVNSYNFLGIRNNPFVDNIYIYTKPKHVKGIGEKLKALFGKIKIFNGIRKEKYDVSVVFRSEYSPSAEQFSNISKAKMRIGVKDKKGRDKFTIHIKPDNNKHEIEFCYDFLKPLEVEYNNEKPYFYVENEYIKKYKHLKSAIHFHISSRLNENQYSKEKFKKIIDNLKYEKIIITAEPKDFDDAEWLEKNTKASFIKTKSLLDLAGIISNDKLFVTLDGGALHIAPALGIKTIAISGKTNMNKWYPWGYKNLVIQDESKIAENIEPEIIIKKVEENI